MDLAMAQIDTNCLQDRDRLVHNMCFDDTGPRMNRQQFKDWCHTEWPGKEGKDKDTRAKVMGAHWQLTKENNPRRSRKFRRWQRLIKEAGRDRQEANRHEEQPTTTDDNDVPPPTVEEDVSQPTVEEDEATQAPDTDMTRPTVEADEEDLQEDVPQPTVEEDEATRTPKPHVTPPTVEADVEYLQCLIS